MTKTRLCTFTLAAALSFGPVAAWQDQPDKPKTADKASNAASDRELMQQVRKAVMDDDSLSMSAKNVKIIAKNGKITLKGNVKSAEEKAAIEAKAVQAAGDGNVMNQLNVKPDKDK